MYVVQTLTHKCSRHQQSAPNPAFPCVDLTVCLIWSVCPVPGTCFFLFSSPCLPSWTLCGRFLVGDSLEGTLWAEGRFKLFLKDKHSVKLSDEDINALRHKFRATSEDDIDSGRDSDVNVYKFYTFVKNRLPPSFLWYSAGEQRGASSAEKRHSKVSFLPAYLSRPPPASLASLPPSLPPSVCLHCCQCDCTLILVGSSLCVCSNGSSAPTWETS